MPQSYSHLSVLERVEIEKLHCEQGLGVRRTAEAIGRSPSTVNRELRRGLWFASNENECVASSSGVPLGVVTFCWTPVSVFFDYAMSPSSRLRFAMLVPNVSLILSSRYQVMDNVRIVAHFG